MSAEKPLPLLVSGRPLPRWRHGLMFLGSMAAVAVVVGLLAAWLQQYFAPVLLFPLLIGLLLGVVLADRMSAWQIGHRPLALLTAVLAALLSVLVIHYASYRFELAAAADRPPEHDLIVQAFPDLEASGHGTPKSFFDYLWLQSRAGRPLASWRARGAWLWAWWTLDALLIAAVGVWMVAPQLRWPYCRQCRAWYRTIRDGQLDGKTAAALGKQVGIALPKIDDEAIMALRNCPAGCGPAELCLIWNVHDGQSAWLDVERLRQVTSTLDAAKPPK